MSKKFRMYPVGSAEHVVAHASYQKSRGRNPSMSFMGIKNPIKALAHAVLQISKVFTYSAQMHHVILKQEGRNATLCYYKGRQFTEQISVNANKGDHINAWDDNIVVYRGPVFEGDVEYRTC